MILDANPPTIRIHDLSKPESTKEQQQDFFIETSFNDVNMPSLRIQLDNLPFGINPKELYVNWTINIRSYSIEKGSFFSNTSYEASYDKDFSFSSNSAEIKPEFNKIVGGYLNVSAMFSFRGNTYFLFPLYSVAVPKDLRILGRNPSVEQVQSFIDRLIPAKGLMPKDSPLSYGNILKKIARHETNNPSRFGLSGYNQFYSIGDYKGLPRWSTNNDGGVGIMQITSRSITSGQVPYIWDWRENIKAGARQLDYGLSTTRRLKDVISSHQGYRSALGNASKDREKEKLPILNEIEFPDLNPLQFIQNAIRIYNGVGGGPDSIGRNILHEWEVKTEGSPNMLDLRVSKITPDPKRPKNVKYIGKVQWVRVSSARRYNRAGKPIGEPDYVNRVMNA